MSSHPVVSIVLVTYNRSSLLRNTIETLATQIYQDFECFIMDDCSTDETENVSRSFCVQDTRFTYIKQQQNIGMPGNLNAGIQLCYGKFIAILHDDDLYRNDMLEKWVNLLDHYPSAAFVFNAYRAIDLNGHTTHIYQENLPAFIVGRTLLEKVFFTRAHFDSPVYGNAMIRRSCLMENGLLQNRYGYFADVELWMRLCMHHDVCYVSDPLMSLSSAPSHFERALWPTEWLVQSIFFDCRQRAFSHRPWRARFEILRHHTFRFLKGTYWFLVFAKRGELNNLPDVLRYMFRIPRESWILKRS